MAATNSNPIKCSIPWHSKCVLLDYPRITNYGRVKTTTLIDIVVKWNGEKISAHSLWIQYLPTEK